MKRKLRASFRKRLFLSLVLTTVVSLVLCAGLLIVLFRANVQSNTRIEANSMLNEAMGIFDRLYAEMNDTADAIEADAVIREELTAGPAASRSGYLSLYAVTEGHRTSAQFHLYDANGGERFSTASEKTGNLPLNRGILYGARTENGVVWRSNDTLDGCHIAKTLRQEDGTIYGYVLITVTRDAFDSLFTGLVGPQNTLLLTDGHWHTIYCSSSAQERTLAQTLRTRLLGGEGLNTDAYSYTLRRSTATDFIFAIQQPQRYAEQSLQALITVAVSMVLVCAVGCVFVALRLSRQLNEPVEKLQAAMQRVEDGDLETRVSLQRDDEFGSLANSFDHMVRRLRDNTEQMVRGQRELDEAQIRLMQAQLNPHFLCNTLDTMKWMGKIHNLPEVAEISTDLADILRSCISIEEFIPLSEELELLHRYIEIQRIRFPDKFEYTIEVPPELLDCIIPKFMLQPLVENAILHGLDNRDSGTIRVSAEQTDETHMRLSVRDNGCGISDEVLNTLNAGGNLRASGHLGLYNVNMILQMHYGADSGLQFENETVGGARVSAVLPIIRKENA